MQNRISSYKELYCSDAMTPCPSPQKNILSKKNTGLTPSPSHVITFASSISLSPPPLRPSTLIVQQLFFKKKRHYLTSNKPRGGVRRASRGCPPQRGINYRFPRGSSSPTHFQKKKSISIRHRGGKVKCNVPCQQQSMATREKK